MYQRSLFTPPKKPQPMSRKRRIAYVLLTALRRMLMALGALVLFSAIVGAIVSIRLMGGTPIETPLPRSFVLQMTLDSDPVEHQAFSSSYFGGGSAVMRDIVDTLDEAAQDERVKGLVVDYENPDLSLGHLEELRAALLRFRAAGKFAYVYAPSYGDPGAGLGTYYLASAFDQIWMQPVGLLSMAGISAEMPFFRTVMDKWGVEPQFFARKEYKSLFESFNNKQMSPANREEMSSLIGDLAGQMTDGIAAQKRLAPEKVKALIDKGLFTDSEAKEAGLITGLDDFTGLKETISRKLTGKPEAKKLFVDFDDYSSRELGNGDGPKVALVYIGGMIVDSSSSPHEAAADDISAAILDAAKDKKVKTIVLRIDSPGGSPEAAETIRLAVMRAKAKGKKIVVSMGDEAASGGYWIASAGDYIFALSDTLTGSIGVAGGKVSLKGLWDKIGVGWDGVRYGDNAGMMSFNEPFSAAGTERMNAMMDEVYDGFIARVAEGRHMTKVQADKVARGRVWTGRQAKEHGLVDQIGGLDAALDYAAKQLKAQSRDDLDIEELPAPQSPIDRLRDILNVESSSAGKMPDAALMREFDALNSAIVQMKYMTYLPLRVR